ncbi:hypothetical protein [Fodinibius sp.]|uniref:hypothetical protein n=1 Tax=Fodinibius sp. TaxID=1872440 RepID=UPI00356A3F0D
MNGSNRRVRLIRPGWQIGTELRQGRKVDEVHMYMMQDVNLLLQLERVTRWPDRANLFCTMHKERKMNTLR